MVRKFLTREQTYSSLLLTVSDSEAKIDNLKRDNDELSARLHELQIDSDAVDSNKTANTNMTSSDIMDANNELQNIIKEYQ